MDYCLHNFLHNFLRSNNTVQLWPHTVLHSTEVWQPWHASKPEQVASISAVCKGKDVFIWLPWRGAEKLRMPNFQMTYSILHFVHNFCCKDQFTMQAGAPTPWDLLVRTQHSCLCDVDHIDYLPDFLTRRMQGINCGTHLIKRWSAWLCWVM